MSRLGTLALARRHLRSGVGGTVLVGLLLTLAVLATALAPRALASIGTDELRFRLSTATPVIVDLSASGTVGFRQTSETGDLERLVGTMDDAITRFPDRFVEPLLSAVLEPQWVAHTIPDDATPQEERPLRLIVDLALDLRVGERIRVLDGELPAPWRPDLDPDAPIEVSVVAATAAAAGIQVGDVLDYFPADLLVTAVYEPVDPDDTYWRHQSDLFAPTVSAEPGALPTLHTSVYIAPETALALQEPLRIGRLEAWIPINRDGIALADAEEAARQVRGLTAAATFLPNGGMLEFRSGFADALDRARERVAAVSALLALSVSGLLGVLLAVVALGIRSVLARRATALTLLAARGASTLQLRAMMGVEGLLVAVPSGLIGLGVAAIVLPEDPGLVGWLAPALLALTPVVLFAALTSPGGLRARRDLRMRGASRARLVVELGIVGLAAVALWLLARRGLVTSAAAVGVDPLLAATPLLLALAVCVLTLRLYPAPLLGFQRLLRGRTGAVGVLGAARAVRDPALGFATALALVVGVSIVVFSTVFVTTVRNGLETAARDAVGADLQVRALVLDSPAVEAAHTVPGVADAVAIVRASAVPFEDRAEDSEVYVVVVDTATLHRIRPDIPILAPGVDGAVPVLVSADWADRIASDAPRLAGTVVTPTGTIPETALPGMSRNWLLVDSSSADALEIALPRAERLLVSIDPGADTATVATALDEAITSLQPPAVRGLVVVDDTASALRDARSPAIASVEFVLLLAAALSLLLVVLTVVLASVAAAAARNRLLGVLRILGMSTHQLRGILAWELGPLAITAAVVGAALGLGLAYIVAAVVDLTPFVGGAVQPDPVVDPLAVLGALAVFLVTVVAAGALAVAFGRRLAPAGALKVGEA